MCEGVVFGVSVVTSFGHTTLPPTTTNNHNFSVNHNCETYDYDTFGECEHTDKQDVHVVGGVH